MKSKLTLKRVILKE